MGKLMLVGKRMNGRWSHHGLNTAYLHERENGTAVCSWCCTRYPARLVRRILDGEVSMACIGCGSRFTDGKERTE